MNKLTSVIEQAKSGWNNLDHKKRILMISILACIVLTVSVLTYFLQKTEYAVLYRNLELEDAGNIANDLETKKIDYKLENDGRDILIDEKHLDEYRLELAMNGLMPENSTGFEIFDDTSMMATDEDRQIMYQRALTGELQRSIMSLDAVNSAKVHLVMPEESIFETEEKEASASVIIDVKPGYEITDDTVVGIASLVSGAVDNLPKENIQVIDSKGNLLSGVLQEDGITNALDVASQYQQIKKNFEEELVDNLYDLLGTAYGKNKIKISVNADLDFDSEETTLITYENPVVRSEQVSASGENIDTQQTTGGNIDDNTSNVIGAEGDGASYERTVNNELSSETTTTVKAPGKVNKITTSVVYDGTLSDEDVTKIRNIVATATGYDIERGDLISVEGVVFDKTYEEELEKELEAIRLEEEQNKSIFEKYGEYIVFALLGVLGLIAIVSVIRNRFVRRRREREELVLQDQVAMDLIGDTTPAENVEQEDVLKVDDNERKARQYAKENPEIAADLIKAWLSKK